MQDSMTARDDFNKQFQEYLRIVYEGKWLILSIFVIIVTATWFYTLQQDDIYQSTATVRLKQALDPLNAQTYQGLGAGDLGFGGERILANEIRVILSAEVSEKVATNLLAQTPSAVSDVDTLPIVKARATPTTLRKIVRSLNLEGLVISLGLTQLDTSSRIADHEVVASRVRAQLSASPVPGLDFINITATSTSPREAANIANLAVEAYKMRNLETARENISTARSYLEDQLEMRRDSLTNSENDLRNFQEAKGLVNLDAEAQSVVSQISTYEASLQQARIELETATRLRSELKRQLEEMEPTLAQKMTDGADPVLQTLLADKANLEIQITMAEFNRKDALRARPELEQYSNKELEDLNRRYQAVLKKIDQTTKQIVAAGDVTGQPLEYSRELRKQIIAQDIQIQSMQARIQGLQRQIGQYNRQFEAIPSQSIEFARLSRRQQTFDKLSALLNDKYQEIVINEQTTLGNVDVIDRAVVPRKPVKPNRPLNMLMGALVALGLGIGVAVGMRFLDNTVRSPEDVEKLGVPVLTFVPKFGDEERMAREKSLVTITAPQSPPSEAYRTMRTAIENLVQPEEGKAMVIVVTSPAPREGKSTAISNLAVSAANSGKRVLLIDADLRRPVQHQIFEVDREPGLSNCLVGDASVNQSIKRTKVPGLHLAPCGHIPSHPAELLGSARMTKFLELVRQYYDLIVIDSPPLIAMADTLVIAKHTDGVAMIVAADSTKTLGVQKAVELLALNNARLLGVVVNRFNANKIYYSYYRYYYQNYYYYSEDGQEKKKKSRKEKVA